MRLVSKEMSTEISACKGHAVSPKERPQQSQERLFLSMSRKILKAAVLGAGTMGAGIAAHLANAGIPVLLLDIAADGDDKNTIVKKASIFPPSPTNWRR